MGGYMYAAAVLSPVLIGRDRRLQVLVLEPHWLVLVLAA
jgi:hypothetical protein